MEDLQKSATSLRAHLSTKPTHNEGYTWKREGFQKIRSVVSACEDAEVTLEELGVDEVELGDELVVEMKKGMELVEEGRKVIRGVQREMEKEERMGLFGVDDGDGRKGDGGKGDKKGGTNAKLMREITEGLGRTTRVLRGEVERSQATGEVVGVSGKRLRNVRDLQVGYSGVVGEGRGTLRMVVLKEKGWSVAFGVLVAVFLGLWLLTFWKWSQRSNVSTFLVRPATRTVLFFGRLTGKVVRLPAWVVSSIASSSSRDGKVELDEEVERRKDKRRRRVDKRRRRARRPRVKHGQESQVDPVVELEKDKESVTGESGGAGNTVDKRETGTIKEREIVGESIPDMIEEKQETDEMRVDKSQDADLTVKNKPEVVQDREAAVGESMLEERGDTIEDKEKATKAEKGDAVKAKDATLEKKEPPVLETMPPSNTGNKDDPKEDLKKEAVKEKESHVQSPNSEAAPKESWAKDYEDVEEAVLSQSKDSPSSKSRGMMEEQNIDAVLERVKAERKRLLEEAYLMSGSYMNRDDQCSRDVPFAQTCPSIVV